MIGAAAWLWALTAAGALVGADSRVPVRLAPVRCPQLPDASVRGPLRVELGPRLLDDAAPDPGEFVVLSIACRDADATLLAVGQGGGTPVRRLLPLGGLAPEARARELALAAAELLHVADLRDAPLVPPAPPPPAADLEQPGAAGAARSKVTFGSDFAVFGGYLGSGNYFSTEGIALRLGVDLGPDNPPEPTWGAGLTYEFIGLEGPYQAVAMNELFALAQRRDGRVVPEIGLGGRLGWVIDNQTAATSTWRMAGGPAAKAGIHARVGPGLWSDFSVEAGYDFHGHGFWLVPHFGATLRFPTGGAR